MNSHVNNEEVYKIINFEFIEYWLYQKFKKIYKNIYSYISSF